jgi:acyl carrier protein
MKILELQIATILEVDPSTIDGAQPLANYPGWNSLAAMQYVVFVHAKFGVIISGDKLAKCKMISDLIALVPVSAKVIEIS